MMQRIREVRGLRPSSLSPRSPVGLQRGPIDLLWDRGPIHRRREVLDFIVTHPRLDVHYFPAYAPELNPAEYVWAQADHELANGAPDDLRELSRRLTDATRRLRRSPDLLWSCISASDLPWAR